jgi:hypothetical protein
MARIAFTAASISASVAMDFHPRALPQGDGGSWPACAGGAIRRQRQLGVLDARQVLDDMLAIDGPHVNAVQKLSSRHYRPYLAPIFLRLPLHRPVRRFLFTLPMVCGSTPWCSREHRSL